MKYIFRKEEFIKHYGIKEYEKNKKYIDKYDGQEILFRGLTYSHGYVLKFGDSLGLTIFKKWCEVVE
ncbi:MAG: hypothetical protein MSH33_07210 [Fusobacterium necrophorum]|nr:hypothetical protein [Fusobacterium necrophorum]